MPKENKLSVSEIFTSYQGEIRPVGKLVTFIRLAGCNLRCHNEEGKLICDTPYSLRYEQGKEMTIKEIVDQVKITPIVITGGEPLLQREALEKLIENYNEVYIETNGTQLPLRINENIHYNVSPKTWQEKIDLNILDEFRYHDSILKFVVRDLKDLEEIAKIVEKIGISKERVYIMPEGITDEEIKKHALNIINRMKELKFNLSPRLQIWLWGNAKGV